MGITIHKLIPPYKIELIFRESTLRDILPYWRATGRTYSADEGQAVFSSVVSHYLCDGYIYIKVSTGEEFYYNLKDFYRVKVIGGPNSFAEVAEG